MTALRSTPSLPSAPSKLPPWTMASGFKALAVLVLLSCGAGVGQGPDGGGQADAGGGAGGATGGSDGGPDSGLDGGPERPRAPTISQFTSSAMFLPTHGGRVQLDWLVDGADTLLLDWPGGEVDVTSLTQTTVAVLQTTTFRLTATGAGGSTHATLMISVAVPNAAPVIQEFLADNSALAAPGWITLSWSQTNAQQLSINNGVGDVTGAGSVQVRVDLTKTFILTASNQLGSTTASRTITVAPQPAPVISTFYASPQATTAGEHVVLHWTGANWTSIRLDPGGFDVEYEFGSTEMLMTQTTTFTLTASAADGRQVTRTTTVTVN